MEIYYISGCSDIDNLLSYWRAASKDKARFGSHKLMATALRRSGR